MHTSRTHNSFAVVVAVSGLLLGGCATTVPTPESVHQFVPGFRISSNDAVLVHIDASQSVNILPDEEQRFARDIEQEIQASQKNSRTTGNSETYEVDVHLTRYDKGSMVARFLLPGFGGNMHIDGNIDVFSSPQHKLLETFALKKTFITSAGFVAYRAFTPIERVEDNFAKSVAETLTGVKGN